MKDKNKKEKNNDQGINPVAAGVTGAVVGAGVAVGAVQALGNKKVQKKAREILENVKDQAIDYLDKNDVKEKITREVDKTTRKK